MKKFYTCAVAFMLAICFASCSAGSGNPSASPAASATEDTVVSSSAAPTPEPRTLTVSITGLADVQTQIKIFALKYPGVTVRFQDSQSNEILATEFMSGIAPDIIYGAGNYNEYGERGLLTDFKTLMANDADFDVTRYISSVLKSTEDTNGSMYAFPFQFMYSGFISVNTSAPASIISDFTSRNGISLDDMLKTYDGLSDGGGFEVVNDFYSGYPFSYRYIYSAYIDYADKTCDFTNPAFIQTMKYIKMYQLPTPDVMPPASDSILYADDSAWAKQYLFHLCMTNGPQYFLPYDSNHFEHPIPLTDQNGNVWVIDNALSIYNGSPNKDLAWELIKYLTSDAVQSTITVYNQTNPVTVKAFMDRRSYWIDRFTTDAVSRDVSFTDAAAVQNALAAYTAINNMPMVNRNGQGSSVDDIITTEFNNFISGATTAEQAAANMQNKVELYLNE